MGIGLCEREWWWERNQKKLESVGIYINTDGDVGLFGAHGPQLRPGICLMLLNLTPAGTPSGENGSMRRYTTEIAFY
jgi:hypothetical protein